MIERAAFLQIDLLNKTQITGRFARYSDPEQASALGAFVGLGLDGTVHYVLWAAIARIAAFPLDADAPEIPAPKPIPKENE